MGTEPILTGDDSPATLGAMVRRGNAASVLMLVLVAVVCLGSALPVWAHPLGGFDGPPALEAEAAPAIDQGVLPPLVPAGAPDRGRLLWLALLAGLMGLGLGSCRRPQVVALGLVLLLGLVAFEMGLHSVHHGADPLHAVTCVVAAASAHLAATAVDFLVAVDVMLPAVAAAPEIDPFGRLTSSLRPDQGRAPPSATF